MAKRQSTKASIAPVRLADDRKRDPGREPPAIDTTLDLILEQERSNNGQNIDDCTATSAAADNGMGSGASCLHQCSFRFTLQPGRAEFLSQTPAVELSWTNPNLASHGGREK